MDQWLGFKALVYFQCSDGVNTNNFFFLQKAKMDSASENGTERTRSRAETPKTTSAFPHETYNINKIGSLARNTYYRMRSLVRLVVATLCARFNTTEFKDIFDAISRISLIV